MTIFYIVKSVFYTSILVSLLSTCISLNAQSIEFENVAFEAYLLANKTVDTVGYASGSPQSYIDKNEDGKIQLDEALLVKHMNIGSYQERNKTIKSIQDLQHFKNLQSIYITKLDSLIEISGIDLEYIKSFIIDDCNSIKQIDISNWYSLTDVLRIESITSLEYLNIQNGSVTDLFSMFYSKNVQEACVDSIFREFNIIQTQQTMANNTSPSLDCPQVNLKVLDTNNYSITISPNPTSSTIQVQAEISIDKYVIFDLYGKIVKENKLNDSSIDLIDFRAGLYFIHFYISDERVIKRVVKL